MPRIINKNQKKAEILKSAIKVIAEKGSNAKMSDIAAQAGIGKGTIYEYFQNKDEIISESIFFYMQEIGNSVNTKIADLTDPFDKLEAFFNGWIDFLDTPMFKYIEVMFHFWAQGILNNSSSSPFDMRMMYKLYRDQLKKLLDDCIKKKNRTTPDTNIISSILIGSLDGLVLQWIVDKEALDLKESIHTVWYLINTFLQDIDKP